MNSLSDAKAVLADLGVGILFVNGYPDPRYQKALAAMIAEVERLTAPLDAEEGRELVAHARDVATNVEFAHQPQTAQLIRKLADLIERQAARIAAQEGEP